MFLVATLSPCHSSQIFSFILSSNQTKKFYSSFEHTDFPILFHAIVRIIFFLLHWNSLPTNLLILNYNHPSRPNSNLHRCELSLFYISKNSSMFLISSHPIFWQSFYKAKTVSWLFLIISLCLIRSPNEQAVHCRISIHILMKSFPTKACINSTNLINQMHI